MVPDEHLFNCGHQRHSRRPHYSRNMHLRPPDISNPSVGHPYVLTLLADESPSSGEPLMRRATDQEQNAYCFREAESRERGKHTNGRFMSAWQDPQKSRLGNNLHDDSLFAVTSHCAFVMPWVYAELIKIMPHREAGKRLCKQVFL